jgi:hypothetical protein
MMWKNWKSPDERHNSLNSILEPIVDGYIELQIQNQIWVEVVNFSYRTAVRAKQQMGE